MLVIFLYNNLLIKLRELSEESWWLYSRRFRFAYCCRYEESKIR